MLIKTLKKWQKIEDRSAESAGEIIESTDNEFLDQIMEIIRSDSERHREVQQLIVDSMTVRSPTLTPEELASIWTRIEEHIDLERKMVQSVEEALDAVSGDDLVVQEYFLRYLLTDERKHDRMLADLDHIKRGMYPYGS